MFIYIYIDNFLESIILYTISTGLFINFTYTTDFYPKNNIVNINAIVWKIVKIVLK